MSIFEDLENLNVSEECFDDIMGIVEEIISEFDENKKVATVKKRIDNLVDATKAAKESNAKFPRKGSIDAQAANLLQTAELKKKQEEAARKVNKSATLASKNIKDPEKRREVINYAMKNMDLG